MEFKIEKTRKKVECSYKTLYLSDAIIHKIEEIAQENDTSFNNVVVSMIKYCLEEKKGGLSFG